MAIEDDDLAARRGTAHRGDDEVPSAHATIVDKPAREASVHDLDTAIQRPNTIRRDDRPSSARSTPAPSELPGTLSITTTAEAMHHEEVERTRTFIRMGWIASLGGLGSLPFVHSPRWTVIAFVAALALGMVVSFGFHQRFRDPAKFGPRSLFALGVIATINTHVAILFYGAFTLAPVLIVIGMHFIGRSELDARRAVLATAMICHGVISLLVITGGMADPGVFATARSLGVEAYVIGALYVQASYALAYYTGKVQRHVSLRSIQQLQRATRVASQRAALLDELRIDLARAQQIGAGRYTDHTLGAFKLGAVIGRGAHGEVYEAQGEGAVVAVKVLHREHLADRTLVARFLREANATTAIASPHVVRVLAVSEPDAAVPYLVMERLRGKTLAELLRRVGKLEVAEVAALVTQIGAALDGARKVNIVHRDLKPQNLFLDGTTWKLVDFGVALLTESSSTLTMGGIVGTPQYMAPEQARGEPVDHRADLHALGVLAYRVLTGRNPFGGSDTPAILYAVVHTMPPRPSTVVALAGDVDRWMAIAMAKQPAQRFASGAEMASALAGALRGALSPEWRARGDRQIDAQPWQDAA